MNIKMYIHNILNLNKCERATLCLLQMEILQLRIMTGGYINKESNGRLCNFCNTDSVEDKQYFIIKCDAYKKIRPHVFYDGDINV